MTIQSNPLLIHCGIEKVSSYLSIPSNLASLLPEDRISEFQSDDQGCAFKVQGGITISLMFIERNEQGIRYVSGNKSPFPFTLQICLTAKDGGVEGYLYFTGDTSPMVAMLAKNPLTALFNDMGQNLKIQLESQS